jgi:hypothetical protein
VIESGLSDVTKAGERPPSVIADGRVAVALARETAATILMAPRIFHRVLCVVLTIDCSCHPDSVPSGGTPARTKRRCVAEKARGSACHARNSSSPSRDAPDQIESPAAASIPSCAIPALSIGESRSVSQKTVERPGLLRTSAHVTGRRRREHPRGTDRNGLDHIEIGSFRAIDTVLDYRSFNEQIRFPLCPIKPGLEFGLTASSPIALDRKRDTEGCDHDQEHER